MIREKLKLGEYLILSKENSLDIEKELLNKDAELPILNFSFEHLEKSFLFYKNSIQCLI